jgi:hypothetical protein
MISLILVMAARVASVVGIAGRVVRALARPCGSRKLVWLRQPRFFPSLHISATPASNDANSDAELDRLGEVGIFDAPRDPHARTMVAFAQIGGGQKLGRFVCSHEQTNRRVQSGKQLLTVNVNKFYHNEPKQEVAATQALLAYRCDDLW